MNAWLTGECGNDPSVAGLVDQIRWYRLCDGSFDASNDRLIRYKLKDGTHALIEAMIRDSKAPLSALDASCQDRGHGRGRRGAHCVGNRSSALARLSWPCR